MHDSNDVKVEVLQDLIDHMKRLEGGKMRPKEVELSVSSMKPEPGEGSPEEEKQDLAEGDHGMSDSEVAEGLGEKSDGDLTPEEASILEELLGDHEHGDEHEA
jgi:hypothetical protein